MRLLYILPLFLSLSLQASAQSDWGEANETPTQWNVVEQGTYANNAIMVCKVIKDGKPVNNADVGLFAKKDDECRGAFVSNSKGYAWVTLYGDTNNDTLYYKVRVGSTNYTLKQLYPYTIDDDRARVTTPAIVNLSKVDNTIVVPTDSARLDAPTAVMKVNLKDPLADYCTMTFTANLPTGISVADISTSDRTKNGDYSVTKKENSDGTYTFSLSSKSDKDLTGTSGNVMTITLSVAKGTKSGTYSIPLKDITLTTSYGVVYPVANYTAKIYYNALSDAEIAAKKALAEAKAVLKDAISAATTEKDKITHSDIATTLGNAITSAQKVYDSSSSTKTQVDKAVTTLNTAVSTANTAEALACDKDAFNAYKTQQQTAAGNMAKADDSAASKKLIATAKKSIGALVYDESKSLAENKKSADAIISKLSSDLGNQRALDASKAVLKDAISTATTEKDKITHSDIATTLGNAITSAQKVYDSTSSTKTQVDKAVTTLNTAVSSAKTAEALACDKDAFNAYKTQQQTAAGNMAKADDSAASKNLISTAKKSIGALVYDESKSLAENKKSADAIISKLNSDLDVQRALDASRNNLGGVISDAKNAKDALTHADIAEKLDKAIKEAQKVYDSATSSKDDIDKAVATLKAAITQAKAEEDPACTKDAFDSYKSDQVKAVADLQKTGDSEACKSLISAAKESINQIVFNDKNTLEENIRAVDDIVSQLKTDLDAQREYDSAAKELSDAIEAANTAKGDITHSDISSVLEGKIKAAQKVLDNPKATKKDIEKATKTVNDAVETAKADEIVACNKDAFDSYKNEQLKSVGDLAASDDSEVCKNLIEKAKSDIGKVEYDNSLSVDAQKKSVEDIIAKLTTDLENQRKDEWKSSLTDLISDAQTWIDDYPAKDMNDNMTLEAAISNASNFANNSESSSATLKDAYSSLDSAMDKWKEVKDAETKKDLSDIIEKANEKLKALGDDVPEGLVDEKNALESAVNSADEVLKDTQSGFLDYIPQISKVKEALEALETATGISDVNTFGRHTDRKMIHNGRIIIIRNNRRYNTDGVLIQ